MQKMNTLFSINILARNPSSTEIPWTLIPAAKHTFTSSNLETTLFTLLRRTIYVYLPNYRTKVHNLIIGSSWVDHPGTLQMSNLRTKDTCVITFEECNWLGSNMHNVAGSIKNGEGKDWYAAVEVTHIFQFND
jgi:hypothetical protein